MDKEKEGEKRRKENRREMRERRKRRGRERQREREEKKKREIFSAFRLSELDGPRRKVDSHIASYAWVPKSWSFVKLHEVGNFHTWNIFSQKVM